MIAADTSILIAYLQGVEDDVIEQLVLAMDKKDLYLPPVVITELLSGIRADEAARQLIEQLPILETEEGYWERAAQTRRKILALKRKAQISDTLIAQSCIDHDVPLLTRDADFHHFAKHCGLKLAMA